MLSTLLLPLLFLLHLCHAHKDGAPEQACLTMAPVHDGTSSQKIETALHKLEFAPAPSISSIAGNNDTTTQVFVATLTAKSGINNIVPFKGFFVQARSTSSGDANPVGMWDVSGAAGLAKGVHCGGVKNSAVTHVDNNLKPSVTLLWSAPKWLTGKVVFVATIVMDYKTFWVGIQSEVLTLDQGFSTSPSSSSILSMMTSSPRTMEIGKAGSSSSNSVKHGDLIMAGNATTESHKGHHPIVVGQHDKSNSGNSSSIPKKGAKNGVPRWSSVGWEAAVVLAVAVVMAQYASHV